MYGNKVKDWTILSQAPFQGEGATIIEVQDTKLDNLSEYVEKMINYGGKVMRCIEEMQSKDYNEKYGRRRYPREEYRDPDYNRYF